MTAQRRSTVELRFRENKKPRSLANPSYILFFLPSASHALSASRRMGRRRRGQVRSRSWWHRQGAHRRRTRAAACGTVEQSIGWRPEQETARAQEKGGGAAPFCGRRRVSTGPRPSPVTCYGKRKKVLANLRVGVGSGFWGFFATRVWIWEEQGLMGASVHRVSFLSILC